MLVLYRSSGKVQNKMLSPATCDLFFLLGVDICFPQEIQTMSNLLLFQCIFPLLIYFSCLKAEAGW